MTTTTPLDTPVNDDELRKQVLKAGEDFAIDRGDALRRAGYNRENALEHYENQFVNAILSQIQKDRQQLLERVKTEVIGEDENPFFRGNWKARNEFRKTQRQALLQLNGGKK